MITPKQVADEGSMNNLAQMEIEREKRPSLKTKLTIGISRQIENGMLDRAAKILAGINPEQQEEYILSALQAAVNAGQSAES